VPPLGKGGEEEAGGLQPSFRKKRETVKLTTSQPAIQEIPISREKERQQSRQQVTRHFKNEGSQLLQKGGMKNEK